MESNILDLLTSRINGASKSEIDLICKGFNTEIPKHVWRRILRMHQLGYSMPIFCKKKRWYKFDTFYQRRLVCLLHEKGNIKYLGMAMGVVPNWINENYELFIKTFNKDDFIFES